MLRKNRKGNIQGVITVIVVLFVLGIAFYVTGYVVPKVVEEMMGTAIGRTEQGAIALNATRDVAETTLDSGYLMLFVLLIISVIATAFLIKAHPVFIPIFIILLGITVVLAVVFSNTFEQIKEISPLNETTATHTYTSTIMSNLVVITIIVGLIAMVIIFAKLRGGGGFV